MAEQLKNVKQEALSTGYDPGVRRITSNGNGQKAAAEAVMLP